MAASYFVLLLEGCVDVRIGQDGMVFEARGFHQFGTNILMDVTSGEMKYETNPYIPDFTVQANTDCLLMLITRRRYMAAFKASKFQEEKEQLPAPSVATEKEVEVFREEWKAAESNDLESSLSGISGLVAINKLLQTKPLQNVPGRRLCSPSVSRGGSLQASPRNKLSTIHSSTTPQRAFANHRRMSPSSMSSNLLPASGEQSNQQLAITIPLEEEEEETEEEDVLKTEKERLLKEDAAEASHSGSSTSGITSPTKDNSRTSPVCPQAESKL